MSAARQARHAIGTNGESISDELSEIYTDDITPRDHKLVVESSRCVLTYVCTSVVRRTVSCTAVSVHVEYS